MSAPTCLLALSLLTASVPSPHTPITPGSLAPGPAMRSPAESLGLALQRHRAGLTLSGAF